MTRRERLEARAAKRAQWAQSRERKSEQANDRAHELSKRFEMGQPILVGHHSEKSARSAQQRMWDATERAVEHADKAREHASVSAGIRSQLDRSIYSDDEDAIERLEERIASLEAQRDRMKVRNAEFRKAHGPALRGMTSYQRDQAMPHQSYELTNLGGNIRRNRERLEQLKRQAEHPDRPQRVIRARRPGACERCSVAIDPGDWIGKFADGWLHVTADGDAWVAACEVTR